MAACGRSDEDQTTEMKEKVELASWGLWPTSLAQCGFL